MKKKRPSIHAVPHVAPIARPEDQWHNGADIEISIYARSLHNAAKLLISKLDRNQDPRTVWDVGPIILLYRQAVELQMKFLVGEGGKFLASPTDHITLFKTHSLRWLAQIVCQIIKAVDWQAEFKCAGIANLAEFSAVIAELEVMEPVSAVVNAKRGKSLGDVPPQLKNGRVFELLPTLDALIDLLAVTADGLAATADLMEIGSDGIEPTIQ